MCASRWSRGEPDQGGCLVHLLPGCRMSTKLPPCPLSLGPGWPPVQASMSHFDAPFHVEHPIAVRVGVPITPLRRTGAPINTDSSDGLAADSPLSAVSAGVPCFRGPGATPPTPLVENGPRKHDTLRYGRYPPSGQRRSVRYLRCNGPVARRYPPFYRWCRVACPPALPSPRAPFPLPVASIQTGTPVNHAVSAGVQTTRMMCVWGRSLCSRFRICLARPTLLGLVYRTVNPTGGVYTPRSFAQARLNPAQAC
jgi:hypothetical protein